MLMKSKICLTALAIYEMLAVSILHFPRICDVIFNVPFCSTWYRYFLFCVIIPGIILIILMWIREIIRAHRRRKFIRRAKNTVNSVMASIRGRVSEHIDMKNMEQIITAAVLMGIKKYADRHPNLRKNVNDIMDVANGDTELDIMSTKDEVNISSKRSTSTNTRKKQTQKKKK